jgi:hypothetical protein
MNRREFIKAASAAAGYSIVGATVIPHAAASQGITQEFLNKFVTGLREVPNDGGYSLFIHPSQYRDLLDVVAREKWNDAYREWRKTKPFPYEPRRILAEMKPSLAVAEVEIGRFSGMQFIEQAELP